MQVDHHTLITQVFCQVLERLAYMFAEPTDTLALAIEPRDGIAVEIGFTGERQGTITLAVSSGMCTDVAANVLGLDPDDKEAKQRGTDAIKELLNVTCGHILTMVAGERAVFDVGVPKVSVLKQGDWEILLSFPETLGFRIDDKPVLMRLVLHP